MNQMEAAGKHRAQLEILCSSQAAPKATQELAFRVLRQAIHYWVRQPLQRQSRFGGYAAPTGWKRTMKIVQNQWYRQVFSRRPDGSFGCLLNGWMGGMPHIANDGEFHELNYVDDLDTGPYFFSGYVPADEHELACLLSESIGELLRSNTQKSRVGVAYYALACDQDLKRRGLLEVFHAFRQEAIRSKMACIVTDLPIRIVAYEGLTSGRPAVTQLAEMVGFRPACKTVDDVDGNVWQQYVHVLPGYRPVTLGELLKSLEFARSEFAQSALWRGVLQVSQSAEVMLSLSEQGLVPHPADCILGCVPA